ILWIAWKAGEVERREPLCLAHLPQSARLRNPRDSTTPVRGPRGRATPGPRDRALGPAGLAHPPRPFLSPGSGRRKKLNHAFVAVLPPSPALKFFACFTAPPRGQRSKEIRSSCRFRRRTNA